MINFLSSLGVTKDFGLFLAAFLASGVLGYIFSNIYFSIYWYRDNSEIAINHKDLFVHLREKINIIDSAGKSMDMNKLTKKDAWTIWSNYWYSNIQNSRKYKGSSKRIDNLIDIVHSLGISMISILIAWFSWFLLSKSTLLNSKSTTITIVEIVLIISFGYNFYKTHKIVERMLNSFLLEQINEVASGNNKIDIQYGK